MSAKLKLCTSNGDSRRIAENFKQTNVLVLTVYYSVYVISVKFKMSVTGQQGTPEVSTINSSSADTIALTFFIILQYTHLLENIYIDSKSV
jgi:hypothetical protein